MMNNDILASVATIIFKRRIQQSELAIVTNSQNVTWSIIMLVASSNYKGVPINVSDVCVSIPGTRETVIKTINKLTEKNILSKSNNNNDCRVKYITFSNEFDNIIKYI